jgi:hypothetical protein
MSLAGIAMVSEKGADMEAFINTEESTGASTTAIA